MKYLKYSIAFLLVPALVLSGCNLFNTNDESTEFERRELPRQLTDQELTLVEGSGIFGFNLMQNLLEKNPDQSHFISPLSIQMAYGMTMNGANGETYTQIQETLGLGNMSHREINEAAKKLIELLTQFDDDVQFNIANSIWYRNTFTVEDDFLETNQVHYNATIESADFNDPETVDRINSWVNDKTEGLIEKITDEIKPNEVMYLINAIYFNGDWTMQFDPEDTRKQPFYLPDSSTVETDMMRMEQQENMHYKRGEDYQAVNLYYGDAGFAMTLVLPDEETDLKNWTSNLNWNKWQELTNEFSETKLTLEMPKFELEYEVDKFGEVLQDMGIVNAFDPTLSDFSRINPNSEDLYISDTRHKTFVRVNEEGTESAAATSVAISLSGGLSISFNRPFFYVIREVESETILFMGTMADPS